MKLFELLSGSTTPEMDAATAPMASTSPMQQPANPGPNTQQTAGLMDTFKNFMTTPQPVGGAPTPPSSAPQQPKTVPTRPTTPTTPQPPAQSSGMISRPFGNSSVGQSLDAINKGLTKP